ncbi:MAG TPA: SCO family protein [Candidatus Binatia bacterium]
MRLKLRISSLVGFIVLTAPLLASTIAAHEPSKTKAEASRRVTSKAKMPPFTLIDQKGKRFDAENKLRGKIVAINFIYTTCSDVCPLFTVEFARLQEALRSQTQLKFFLVSITTDPEIDSPKVLEAYARRFGADFQNWAFLTGDESRLKDVWKGFGVQVVRRDRGLVQHTNLTTLVDAQGIRRINFLGSQWQSSDFLKDMRALSPSPP